MGLNNSIYSKERRRYVRYKIEGSVILRIKDKTVSSVKVDLVDISFLGIGVDTQEEIKTGVKCQFELRTKLSGKAITGRARIKNVKELTKGNARSFRIGLEFIEVDKDAVQFLINGIQRAVAAEKRKEQKFMKESSGATNWSYF